MWIHISKWLNSFIGILICDEFMHGFQHPPQQIFQCIEFKWKNWLFWILIGHNKVIIGNS